MKFDYKAIINDVSSKKIIPRLIIVTIAIILLALNYNIFLLHNSFVIGGASGIATIFNSLTGVNPATFLFVFNIVTIIISFRALGPRQTGLTIIGSILYPVCISLTSNISEIIAEKLVFDNFILITIVSGFIYGVANGFTYKTGFSTGGADTIIQIMNKYLKMPTGTASLLFNTIIIIFGAVIFGINKAIYAIIIVAINSFLVDKIMLGISDSKMFYIYTKKPKEVKAFINEMQSGYTIMRTEGGYSNKENDLIMCVISTSDYFMFKNVITEIDPNSFFIISDCYQVYGGHRKERFPFN